jgi:hypothetical protein
MPVPVRVRSVGRFAKSSAKLRGARLARRVTDRPQQVAAGDLEFGLERYTHAEGRFLVSGWAYHRGRKVLGVGYKDQAGHVRLPRGFGHASPDIAATLGPDAARCRFSFSVSCPDAPTALSWTLCVFLDNGSHIELPDVVRHTLESQAYSQLWQRFLEMLAEKPKGEFLEIGARARSGNTYNQFLPSSWNYTGFDILDGPNVDVVGDAHDLSSTLFPESVDAFLSIATFEHLAMPWKVALELNAVLRTGGIGLVVTHQCWPVHEAPWDFWRFTDSAWQALFNRATGFEIVSTAMGEPATVTARIMNAVTAGLPAGEAYLGSSVLVRKIGPTSLTWDVDIDAVVGGFYPE